MDEKQKTRKEHQKLKDFLEESMLNLDKYMLSIINNMRKDSSKLEQELKKAAKLSKKNANQFMIEAKAETISSLKKAGEKHRFIELSETEDLIFGSLITHKHKNTIQYAVIRGILDLANNSNFVSYEKMEAYIRGKGYPGKTGRKMNIRINNAIKGAGRFMKIDNPSESIDQWFEIVPSKGIRIKKRS